MHSNHSAKSKVICILLVVTLLMCTLSINASAARRPVANSSAPTPAPAPSTIDDMKLVSSDKNTHYYANDKDEDGLSSFMVLFSTTAWTAHTEIKEEEPEPTPIPTPTPTPEPKPTYTEEDLYWLSRAVFAETGCDWMPDWVMRATASVIINRVNSPKYPNTIKGVLWQPGQYGCVWNGMIYNTPTQKVIDNCRWVLENGSTLPAGVVGQSGYPLGPVYTSYYDYILGTTVYYFYV